MAEQQQIELDTDGIEEKEIQIEPKKVEEAQDDIGTVDLGYSDPIQKDVKAEVKKDEQSDSQEDNLQEHSDSVQKRINQLTRKMREAERREKAALDYAKGLQAKYQKVESDYKKADKSFIDEYESRVNSQTEQVQNKLKSAMQEQNHEEMMKAQTELTQLAVEKEKAKLKKEQYESQEKTEKEDVKETQPPQPNPSPRAQEWANDNKWFGQDKVMTNAAFTIHTDLLEKGFDPESDDYYTEIDKQLRDNFPNKFATEKPIQTVASAGRKQQGRRTVKLTRSQVAIAKRLGVPLEEYAKFVKE
jgi:chromosome segregation ATPase